MQNILQKAQAGLHQTIPKEFDQDLPHRVGDDWAMDDMEFKQAAVLVAIVDKIEPSVIFTRRPMHMKKHAGQIAFPGGKLETADKDAAHAALREAEEEIGLDAQFTDVLGYLDVYHIGSGFKICPVVVKVSPGFELKADPNEVEEIFEVPLDFLMAKQHLKIHNKQWMGKMRQYYAVEYNDYLIWGATAGMLNNMRNMLNF